MKVTRTATSEVGNSRRQRSGHSKIKYRVFLKKDVSVLIACN